MLRRWRRQGRPSLDPTLAAGYNTKAGALLWLKRSEAALATIEQSLRLDPNSSSAHLASGTTLLSLKRYEEALAAYDQAERLSPNNVNVYSSQLITLLYLGRYRQALRAWWRYVQARRALRRARKATNPKRPGEGEKQR